MKQTFETLEQIALAPGRNAKMVLLHSLAMNEFAAFYFETIFNPYLTYGVTPNPVPAPTQIEPWTLQELKELRSKLASRELSGNAARQVVDTTYNTKDPLVNKWMQLMWAKNMRIGISNESIDKVYPGLIPKFELALCDKIEKQLLDGNAWIVEPKYDGLRCVFIFDEFGKCIASLSRNGKELFNVDHIKAELEGKVRNAVLDGELYGLDWNESASIVRSSVTKKTSETLKFYVFDMIPKVEWDKRKCLTPLRLRKSLYMKPIYDGKFTTVVGVPYYPVQNVAEAWKYAEKFKAEGFEGAVAKYIHSPYVFDRSEHWLKMKFVETFDLEIVGTYLGTGKNKDRLGGLIVKMPNGATCRCGGGFSDVQRTEFWVMRDQLVGKIAEVECQEKTKDGLLRFPEFVRLREDKSPV